MNLNKKFEQFCANCGTKFEASIYHGPKHMCSIECFRMFQLKYYTALLGKDPPSEEALKKAAKGS